MSAEPAIELAPGERIVGCAGDVEPGKMILVPVGPFGIGIFNVGGKLYALGNRCPHRGAPVCRGQITGVVVGGSPQTLAWSRDGEFLACPWHAWEFEIATGRCHAFPDIRIRTYGVRVQDGVMILSMRPAREGGE